MTKAETAQWWANSKRAWAWLVGPNPQGAGTFILGIAAVIALLQTNSIIDKVLVIQKQASNIETLVVDIKRQSAELSIAIKLLQDQVKEGFASKTIETSPSLQKAKPTKEEIEKALQGIPTNASTFNTNLFLPDSMRNKVVHAMSETTSPLERTQILKNSLIYSPNKLVPAIQE